jgi:hypothetical protein
MPDQTRVERGPMPGARYSLQFGRASAPRWPQQSFCAATIAVSQPHLFVVLSLWGTGVGLWVLVVALHDGASTTIEVLGGVLVLFAASALGLTVRALIAAIRLQRSRSHAAPA